MHRHNFLQHAVNYLFRLVHPMLTQTNKGKNQANISAGNSSISCKCIIAFDYCTRGLSTLISRNSMTKYKMKTCCIVAFIFLCKSSSAADRYPQPTSNTHANPLPVSSMSAEINTSSFSVLDYGALADGVSNNVHVYVVYMCMKVKWVGVALVAWI